MKLLLICLACISSASCTPPPALPPGMPLDRDRLLPEDSAITKVTR